MKNLILAITLFSSLSITAQNKKDGTPDMRYNANKQAYGNSYSTPSYSPPKQSNSYYSEPKVQRNYDNGGQYKVQDGYQKSNGTYVAPHLKTTPDNNIYNNYKPRK